MTDIVTAAASAAIEKAVEKIVKSAMVSGWRRLRWLPITMFGRSEPVRVSCSAFLRVKDDRQRYLLIRNFHRPDFFGPIGGCHKFRPGSAGTHLESFSFSADEAFATDDAVHDLRAYIRRGQVASYFKWFTENHNERENSHECLNREIAEEIFHECGSIPHDFKPAALQFLYVRSFLEKSRINDGRTLQFKHFEVYDLDLQSTASRKFLDFLLGTNSDYFVWATAKDILYGRTAREQAMIGHAAVLLVQDRLSRPDLPLRRRQA